MLRNDFIDMLYYNEPTFTYNGKEYSICHPEDKYYVTAEDRPEDAELEFNSPDDLLDNWIIQGKSLGEICEQINFD
ncbi:MAG: hypothetical protein KHX91_06980 [Clostridium sp.]|nr:hypothetical protein [Clostridium sp.]